MLIQLANDIFSWLLNLFDIDVQLAVIFILNFSTFLGYAKLSSIRIAAIKEECEKKIAYLKKDSENDIDKLAAVVDRNREEARGSFRDLWKTTTPMQVAIGEIRNRVKMHADHFDMLDKIHTQSLNTAERAEKTSNDARIISERAITKVESL